MKKRKIKFIVGGDSIGKYKHKCCKCNKTIYCMIDWSKKRGFKNAKFICVDCARKIFDSNTKIKIPKELVDFWGVKKKTLKRILQEMLKPKFVGG